MRLLRWLSWSFLALTALFYGVVFAGQVLGLLKLYNLWLAVSLSLLCSGVVFYLFAWQHEKFTFLPAENTTFSEHRAQQLLNIALLCTGLVVFFTLAFYPLVRWPFSPISKTLNWDAGLYHFPKAIELLVTSSAWDLTIDYGEYPFGYESLLALAFGLNPSGYLIGLIHALIALYFLLAWWLVMVRFTRLPYGLLLFIAVLLSLSRLYLPGNETNLWWILWPQISLIGKNDLLLGALLLAITLFTPTDENQSHSHLLGLAVTSMLAVSVKPNAVLLIVFAWVTSFFFMLRHQGWQQALFKHAHYALLVLPGVLWAIRNLVAMNSLFKASAARLSSWSIAANLSNPYFYEHLSTQFYLMLGIATLSILAAWIWPKMRLPSVLGFMLLLTFALTPASAFLGNNQQPAQIAWRFAVGLLAYQAVLLLLVLQPVISKIYQWVTAHWGFTLVAVILVISLGAFGVWRNRQLLQYRPSGDLVLRDQFEQAVGSHGYFSAYDYVQKNVHQSVVIVENGLPFYLYDRPFTNSVTRSRDADYFVAFQTAWLTGRPAGYPEMIQQPEFTQQWELVYEDSQGRVYKRKP
ncbi:MAG: hypothetical protein DDG60_03520 [Anaerolineae bacterium]|nr:MAG: hypothetical protein DDG60_03520 [Anaerolineae bacterium]